MKSENQPSQESKGLFAGGLNKMKNLFANKDDKDKSNVQTAPINTPSTTTRASGETYHAWGVRWSGNAGANHTALNPALQSCYTQNINEQNNDQANRARNQQNINSQIQSKKGQRDGEKIRLESKERDKGRLNEESESYRNQIDDIKRGESTNIMAKVNFVIGSIIAFLLAIYLFVFYSSASFSAFFGNNDISGAGEAILDPHCYAEAAENGFGQLLFILLMPIIFLGLGFLIHQFGEANRGFAKYAKITGLYLVTFIFDALLAFEISEKVYEYTVLTEETYTVAMAFNSPNFWIVIFSGFVAYVIWGLVFDFTLQHFDNMNAHTREIKVLEDRIRLLKSRVDVLDTEISQIQLNINTLETEIAQLETQLQDGSLIDINILKRALSEFFTGWVAYMNLAAKPQTEKDLAAQTYNQFISQI